MYTDGVLKGQTDGYTQSWSESLVAMPDVVAVKCHNVHGVGGIMVSVGDLLKSDAHWKCMCMRSAPVGWTDPGFDDSSWSYTYEISFNDASVQWEVDARFQRDVKWIWADEYWQLQGTDEREIYCRRRTGLTVIALLRTVSLKEWDIHFMV